MFFSGSNLHAFEPKNGWPSKLILPSAPATQRCQTFRQLLKPVSGQVQGYRNGMRYRLQPYMPVEMLHVSVNSAILTADDAELDSE